MPFFMQCHFCQNKFNLPYTAVETTCPNCHQRFRVDHLDKAFTWEESPPPAVTELEDFELVPKSFSALAPPVEPNYMKPVAKTTPAPRVPQPLPTDFEDDISASNWVSPWGLAAFCFAVLALLLASVVGMRILTI